MIQLFTQDFTKLLQNKFTTVINNLLKENNFFLKYLLQRYEDNPHLQEQEEVKDADSKVQETDNVENEINEMQQAVLLME